MNYCKTCSRKGYFQDGTLGCSLNHRKINPEEDFCSWHRRDEMPRCAYCNNIVEPEDVVIIMDTQKICCNNCSNNIGRRGTCAKRMTCEYETNLSPLPKIVMKQMRQGNSIVSMQGHNPEREKLTCFTCTCWDEIKCVCKRTSEGYCEKWY